MTGIEISLVWIVIWLFIGLSFAWASPAIIGWASNGTATISRTKVLIACLAGCIPGLAALVSGSAPMVPSFTLLGVLLMLMAVMDRQTSWAPDLIMIPLCCVAMWVGAQHSAEDPEVTRIILRGLGFFAFFQIVYLVLSRYPKAIPPPDMIGLAMPFAIFGISPLSAASLMFASLGLIAIRQSRSVRDFVLMPGVGNDISQGRGLHVPFLVVIFPVLVVLLMASPLLREGGDLW